MLLDEYVPLDVEGSVHWLLTNAEKPSIAVQALKAAVRHTMWEVVTSALDHRYADVVAAALHAIASTSDVPLGDELLSLAQSRSSTIRKALVAILNARPHRGHLTTLLTLLSDGWSQDSDGYGSNDNFPIARQAMEAAAVLSPLNQDEMQAVYRVVVATSDLKLRKAGLRIFAVAGR